MFNTTSSKYYRDSMLGKSKEPIVHVCVMQIIALILCIGEP